MLSVAKLTLGQEAYYERSVAQGLDDYYSGKGESPGIWHGTAAHELELEGVVADGDLGALLSGLNPASGDRLRSPVRAREITVRSLDRERGEWVDERKRLQPVTGYDLVFSTPKSVSLLRALTPDPDVRLAISEAHDIAWQAAVGYLEREACVVRRGKAGAIREPAAGFVAGAFRHRTSRALDPHLHTHVIVANLSRTHDGKWRALDGEALLKTYRLAAGYLYEAQLRHELTERLGVTWTPPMKGMAEIHGIPDTAIRAFSTRRQELVEHLDHLGLDHSPAATRTAALTTRDAKTGAVDLEQLRVDWWARAEEHGLSASVLGDAVGHHRPEWARGIDQAALADQLTGPSGLTEKRTTFTHPDLVQAIANAHTDGAPVEEIERLARWVSRDPRLETIDPGREPGRPGRYTTRELLDAEQRGLTLATRPARDHPPRVETALAEGAITAAPVRLSWEQQRLVRDVTQRNDPVICVVGVAGAGKTTALATLTRAYEAAGIPVLGAAPTGRAAEELAQHTGIQARTLHSLNATAGRCPLPAGCLLIVDEAGVADTRTLTITLHHARAAGAKVVLVGDPNQLPAVGAGGLYHHLLTTTTPIELTTNRRQQDASERAALARLRVGDSEHYLAWAAKQGRLHTTETALDAKLALLSDWWHTAQIDPTGSLMIAHTRRDVRDLNQTAHQLMDRAGQLGHVRLRTVRLELATGDRIVCFKNEPRLNVTNGTRATITHLDPDTRTLRIRTDDGRDLSVNQRYLDAGHIDHAYATTAHKAQGLTADHVYVLVPTDGAIREWAYVALTRGHATTRLYGATRALASSAPADSRRTCTDKQLADALKRSQRHYTALAEAESRAATQPDRSCSRRRRVLDHGPRGLSR